MGDYDLGFDVRIQEKVETTQNLLPNGEYLFRISAVEKKTSKTGNNYLQFNFKALKPKQFIDRDVFVNFMTDSNNETARKIARYQIKEISEAVKIENPKSFLEFQNKILSAKVITRKSKDPQYGDQNGLVNFAAADSFKESVKLDDEIPF